MCGAYLGEIVFVFADFGIFVIPENVLYMTEALLQGDNVHAQLMAILDKIFDLGAGIGIAVGYLRFFLEGVGGFPFHQQRVDTILVEVPGKGFQGWHFHDLDAEVEMEAFDGEVFLG